MKRRALLTGINGQDASYLAEFLLEKDYEVIGTIRRSSFTNISRIKHIENDIKIETMELNDAGSMNAVIKIAKPHEVYNLASVSHVQYSFENPEYAFDITANAVTRLLEAIRFSGFNSKFYQASSSEMFGNTPLPQNEESYFNPQSPYAIAKLSGYHMTRLYRKAYNMFTCNGILFNHESPRRGNDFVTKKIVKQCLEIKKGKRNYIELGDLSTKRDWGYSKEYVTAMWAMLQHSEPDDFVVGTGETHTVKEFLDVVLKSLGLEDNVVRISQKFMRPADVYVLQADASKIKRVLGWEAKVKYSDLAKIMITEELNNE
jgi:GDPmannose 4,6-dehydratase